MKYLKSLVSLAVLLVCCAIAGCGTFGAPPQSLSPSQVATQLCGPTQSVLAVLKTDMAIAASGQSVINKVSPQVATICASASTATAVDLQSLNNFAFTVVMPIAEATHPELVPELLAVQAIAGIVAAQQPPK